MLCSDCVFLFVAEPFAYPARGAPVFRCAVVSYFPPVSFCATAGEAVVSPLVVPQPHLSRVLTFGFDARCFLCILVPHSLWTICAVVCWCRISMCRLLLLMILVVMTFGLEREHARCFLCILVPHYSLCTDMCFGVLLVQDQNVFSSPTDDRLMTASFFLSWVFCIALWNVWMLCQSGCAW